MPPEPDIVTPENVKAVDVLRDIKEDIKAITKPAGWKRKTVSPYYRVKFALEVKQVIDGMIADKEDRVYYYEKFAKQPFKFSPNTLYSYVYQALRFLKTEVIEGVDTEYYRKVLEKVITTRDAGIGVRLSFHTDIAAAYVDIAPDKIQKKSENSKLKDKIDKWIETSRIGDRLKIDKIGLSDIEVQELSEMLAGTEDFLTADITKTKIDIVRTA